MMDKISLENVYSLKSSSPASGEIDYLRLIAAQINSQWKRNTDTDFITENQQQQKRQKKNHDYTNYTAQQDYGKKSKVEAIQWKDGDSDSSCITDNKTQYLQTELEKVRQKCAELESENTQFRRRLVENDNKFDEIISSYENVLEGKNKEIRDNKDLCTAFKQKLTEKSGEINKLENEREKFQNEIKGLNKLIENHDKQSELSNDRCINFNFENKLKGKQEEIEYLRKQLDEMMGFAKLKGKKERGDLENDNLRLKNEISEMEGLFEEIQDQFDNKLKEKNSEVVEMMVEWMENHEVLTATQEEIGKLKSQNDCSNREITKLTGELAAKQAEYGSQTNSLKKLERDLKANISENNRLNKKLKELTTKHDQKLKKTQNESNQRDKCIQQMKGAAQNTKHENEEMKKKLLEVECKLNGKQAEIELLLSDRDQIISFA